MSEFWVVYGLEDGIVRWRGGDQAPGSAAKQVAPEGLGVLQVPEAALLTADVDLAVVKADLALRVSAGAEQVRKLFVTEGSGKMASYLEKRDEAARWTADHAAAVPILAYEAELTGKTLAALIAEVQTMAAVWVQGETLVNGAEQAAKRAIAGSANIAELAAAANIDWAAIAAQIPLP